MAKLRLIKPWRLQPLRLKIDMQHSVAAVYAQPCSGPVVPGDEVGTARFSPCNIRTAKVTTERTSASRTMMICEVSKKPSLNPRS